MMTATLLSNEPVLNQARLESLVEDIVAQAHHHGASASEAAVSIESGLSVTVRMGEVEVIEHNRDKGLGVTVYFGQRKGSASTSDFTPAAIAQAVKAACTIARYTAADEFAGLASKELMAKNIPDLDLYHPWNIDAEAAIVLAEECESQARQADVRISNSEGATVSSHQRLRVYGNSHGFCGGYASTRHSISCAVIARDDRGMQRDYWYSVARDQNELEPAADIGRHAAQRTLKRLGSRRVKTQQAPVVFAAEIAGSLFSHFVRAIGGGNLYRHASFLEGHLGERVFPDFVHIYEYPHLKKALGSTPFDNDGVATYTHDLVSNGIIKNYVLDTYAARKLGMESTGNSGGIHNLLIDCGKLDLAGLLREMHKGLLVTELMGMGVNIVTGDYSRGAAGYWIENGEIAYPVEEITIAGNLGDIFMHIKEVGSDVDIRGNIRTGSILIDGITIAGT
jgi:PmbA protein